jgi:hypothetical protein
MVASMYHLNDAGRIDEIRGKCESTLVRDGHLSPQVLFVTPTTMQVKPNAARVPTPLLREILLGAIQHEGAHGVGFVSVGTSIKIGKPSVRIAYVTPTHSYAHEAFIIPNGCALKLGEWNDIEPPTWMLTLFPESRACQGK